MDLGRTAPLALAFTAAATIAGAALLPAPFALASPGASSKKERVEKKIEIVLKVDGETLKLDEELEPGQSRSLRTESGQPATVRRDGDELVISVAGKERRVRVISAAGDGFEMLPGGPSCTKKVKRISAGNGRVVIDEDEDCPMWCPKGAGADCMVMLGDPLAHVDLDELKSLKGASADVKAKVREILDEIRQNRKSPKVMTFEKKIVLEDGDEDGDRKVIVRDGGKQKKVMVIVDGDDEDEDERD